MARFVVTMNMAGSRGAMTHTVIAEHEADTLESFASAMEEVMFITVVEYYTEDSGLVRKGPIVLNTQFIGKVAAFDEHRHQRRA